jgi:translation elongation factor EF-Tu-like GTPase
MHDSLGALSSHARREQVIRRNGEMANDNMTVRANVRLLPTSESGRARPIKGSYRPNHNFFGPDNRNMAIGFIDLPEGKELWPGESIEVTMVLLIWPELEGQIHPGRQWRIQEGEKLVGIGTVIEVFAA